MKWRAPLIGEDKRFCFDFRWPSSLSLLLLVLGVCVVLSSFIAQLAVAAAGGELFKLVEVSWERVVPVIGLAIPFTRKDEGWPDDRGEAWDTLCVFFTLEVHVEIGLLAIQSFEICSPLSTTVAFMSLQSFSMCAVLMWKLSSSYETPDKEQNGQAITFSMWPKRRWVLISASDGSSSQQMSHTGMSQGWVKRTEE